MNGHFWRDRPVPITGATGLIGSWLARQVPHRSPLFTLDEGIQRTISWYREFLA